MFSLPAFKKYFFDKNPRRRTADHIVLVRGNASGHEHDSVDQFLDWAGMFVQGIDADATRELMKNGPKIELIQSDGSDIGSRAATCKKLRFKTVGQATRAIDIFNSLDRGGNVSAHPLMMLDIRVGGTVPFHLSLFLTASRVISPKILVLTASVGTPAVFRPLNDVVLLSRRCLKVAILRCRD